MAYTVLQRTTSVSPVITNMPLPTGTADGIPLHSVHAKTGTLTRVRGVIKSSLRHHRLLQEPVDSVSSHWGPVAQVRIAARAFGQPWPHQPQHGRFAIVVDALRPALHLAETAVTLAVCVLTARPS